MKAGRVRKVPCRSCERCQAVVVQCEDWRGQRRTHDIATVKRFSFNDDIERDDVHGDRHITVRARAVIRIGADHVIAVGDPIVWIECRSKPMCDCPRCL